MMNLFKSKKIASYMIIMMI